MLVRLAQVVFHSRNEGYRESLLALRSLYLEKGHPMTPDETKQDRCYLAEVRERSGTTFALDRWEVALDDNVKLRTLLRRHLPSLQHVWTTEFRELYRETCKQLGLIPDYRGTVPHKEVADGHD